MWPQPRSRTFDGLRDDYIANIGDAARLTADAIVSLAAAPSGAVAKAHAR